MPAPSDETAHHHHANGWGGPTPRLSPRRVPAILAINPPEKFLRFRLRKTMMNFMMMMIEWMLLFTTSINSRRSNSSLSAFNSIEPTSSHTQQQLTPFQTYFPIDASMNSCQWKHHLVYTKSFNELVDSRVREFLKDPLAAPSCQRSIEPSIKCSWWEWNLRCTEELVVFPISDRISSFLTSLGKQWIGSPFQWLDYHFHKTFYNIDDDYYSGAEMLHSYLSFEMHEELISAAETTVTTDNISALELASLRTTKTWLDVAAVKVSVYAKIKLLDLLRTVLRYIVSTQEKHHVATDSSADNPSATKDESMSLWEKVRLSATSIYIKGDDWILAWGLVVLTVALCNVKELQTIIRFGVRVLGRVLVRLFGIVDYLFIYPTSTVDNHKRVDLDELLDLTGNNAHKQHGKWERDALDYLSKTNPSKLTSLGRAILKGLVTKMPSEVNPAERFVLFEWNPEELDSFQQIILQLLVIKCSLYFG